MQKKNNFFSILKFTYSQGLKAKWFLVSTLCGLLIMLAMFNMDNIQKLFSGSNDTQSKIAVVNQTDSISSSDLLNEITCLAPQFDYKEETDTDTISKDLESGTTDYDALIVFNKPGNNSTVYYSSKTSSTVIKNGICTIADNIAKTMSAKEMGLNQKQINILLKTSMVDEINYSDNKISPQVIGMLFVIVLFMVIVLYGSTLSNSVVEEKTNRIVETLLCYVKPINLMFGKIVGILSLAITQILLFTVIGFVMSKIFIIPDIIAFSISPKLLIVLILNILLGYLIYACIFVASVSFSDNPQDSTQLMMPGLILLLISYFVPYMLIGTSDISTLNLLSYIPFLAPISFVSLVSITEVTIPQIVLNSLVQIVEILIVGFICSKLYVKGICGNKLLKGMKRK